MTTYPFGKPASTPRAIAFGTFLTLCLLLAQVGSPLLGAGLRAQSSYRVDSNSVINLKGTSTLHDWSMTARSFTGTAMLQFAPDHQLSSVSAFSLQLPVHNLKSESRNTEKHAYKALKEDKYKTIQFDLTSADFTSSGSANYILLLHGNLTMAGVTHGTTLKLSAAVNEDGTIGCSGSLPVCLSDYDIERPSFLLGAMKIGDVLTLSYTLLLVR